MVRLQYVNPKPHYFFVLYTMGENALLVNTSSFKGTEYEDLSCIVMPGDYSGITKKSIVMYGLAIEPEIEKLEEAKSLPYNPKLQTHQPISDELLNRMRDGAKTSPAFPEKFKKKYCLEAPPPF